MQSLFNQKALQFQHQQMVTDRTNESSQSLYKKGYRPGEQSAPRFHGSAAAKNE